MKKITTFLLIFLMTFCFIGKVSAANRKVKLIPENQFDYGEIIDWAKTFGNYKALCVYEIKSDIPYDGFDTGWKAVIRNYDYHFIFLVTNDDDLEYTGIQKAVGYDGDSIDGNLNFKIYGEQWIKDNIDKLSLKKLSKNKNDFQKFLGVTADNFKKSDGSFCPKFYIAVIND